LGLVGSSVGGSSAATPFLVGLVVHRVAVPQSLLFFWSFFVVFAVLPLAVFVKKMLLVS